MRYYFHSFGCRVNQYDTQSLREKLLGDGVSTASEDYESADVCVINTCTVTATADHDALRLIRRITRRNPAARMVVTGCLASRDPQMILDEAPGATVVGNDGKDRLPAMLGCRTGGGLARITSFGGRGRAFVKVQDGCNMHCTFCIIPSVRPKLECKPILDLEREVRGLIEGGFSEIVLCGIRLGRYLVEDPAGRRVDFVAMLERLSALKGDFRIRLSSLEITDVTDRFIDFLWGTEGKVCPSLHLPLQSGSEAVLKRMKRWYSAQFYARRIASLRTRLPGVGLFADIMVGFPWESDAEFEEGFRFVEGMDYSGLHIFRYSKRRGTPAARQPGQVLESDMQRRVELMRALDVRQRARFAQGAVGQLRRVAMENRVSEGVSEDFLTVRLEKHPGPGLHQVRISGALGGVVLAQRA